MENFKTCPLFRFPSGDAVGPEEVAWIKTFKANEADGQSIQARITIGLRSGGSFGVLVADDETAKTLATDLATAADAARGFGSPFFSANSSLLRDIRDIMKSLTGIWPTPAASVDPTDGRVETTAVPETRDGTPQ